MEQEEPPSRKRKDRKAFELVLGEASCYCIPKKVMGKKGGRGRE